MRSYLLTLFSGLPLFTSWGVTPAGTDSPNIVVILADDLGSNELSCYGGENLITPHIDRIATEGMRFTNNYASCAMSVPLRASLYTGLYPAHHGSFQNHKASYPDIKSVTHYLSQTGYRVGRAGKQHTNPRSVFDFEEISGFETICTSRTAEYTIDGIRKFITKDNKPFCLFVCSIHPHAPWTWGNPEEFDKEKIVLPPNCVDNDETRELFRRYLAEIRALDNEVGSVLEVLGSTGQLDNTLIIFLGEQGPKFPFGKWTCWQYGTHSAMLARYPKTIKPRSTTDAIVQYEDILPTLMDFIGNGTIGQIDGRSFLPVLQGKKKEHRKWAYCMHNNVPEGNPYLVRSIQDKRYKLILNLKHDQPFFLKHMMGKKNKDEMWESWLQQAGQNEQARFLVDHYTTRPAIEFYDLKNDPWELNNIATERKHTKRIATMQAALEKWMTEQGDTGAEMDIRKKQ